MRLVVTLRRSTHGCNVFGGRGVPVLFAIGVACFVVALSVVQEFLFSIVKDAHGYVFGVRRKLDLE